MLVKTLKIKKNFLNVILLFSIYFIIIIHILVFIINFVFPINA